MGNESKVKKIDKKSKNIFLKDALAVMGEKPKVYSLEDEFAGTKKNKSKKLFWYVLGFISLLIFNAVAIKFFVERNSRKMKIQIGGSADVKFSEIFNMAEKNKNRLSSIRNKISGLNDNLQREIQKLKNKFAKQREEAYREKHSSKKEKALISRINKNERESVALLRKDFTRKISASERERIKVQREVGRYNKQLREVGKKAEKVVDNYKKLHVFQMEEQKEDMILKYNPKYDSEELNEIISRGIDTDENKTLILNAYYPDLSGENIINEGSFNKLRKKIDDSFLLITRLRRIPYENSVAPSLMHIDYLSRGIINDYENFWNRFYKLNQNKNKIIDEKNNIINKKNEVINKKNEIINNKNSFIKQYKYALNYITMKQSENGHIIDPRDPANIIVFINKIHNVKPGDFGLVFRNDDEYIGKIKFFIKDGEIRAEAVELHKKNKIMPFDKILIQIKKEKK